MASKAEQKSTDLDKAEESRMLRNKGNSAYGKKQFLAALAHYSQSILQAPLKSREAALSLGNRSAVFFEMGEWSKCLEDTEAAVEFFAYPVELSYKLLDRSGY